MPYKNFTSRVFYNEMEERNNHLFVKDTFIISDIF